jgi:hypothetical protein
VYLVGEAAGFAGGPRPLPASAAPPNKPRFLLNPPVFPAVLMLDPPVLPDVLVAYLSLLASFPAILVFIKESIKSLVFLSISTSASESALGSL